MKYNQQEITEYLLGALPETETERFDELSFTDGEFADALNSTEKDLVDAYVHNELAGAMLKNFETNYLASPLRREKVEFAKVFQTFTENNISQAIEEKSVTQEPKTKQSFAGFFSILNIFANPIFRRGFAVAALAFVFFGGLWLINKRFKQETFETVKQDKQVQTNQEPSKQIEERDSENVNVEIEVAQANVENNSQPKQPEIPANKNKNIAHPVQTSKKEQLPILPKISVASFILIPTLRGGSKVPSFSVPKETTDIKMQLELESDDYPSYQAALTDESGSVNIWRSGKLRTSNNGENKHLNVRFPAKLLKSRIYSLVVTGVNSTGEAEIINNYSFQVVLK